MLRSVTVCRVVLVLAIASVFGLAMGAGMALVGAYITGQNQQDGIALLGQGNLTFAQIPPPRKQALDLMMGCTDDIPGGRPECVIINQSNGQYWYPRFCCRLAVSSFADSLCLRYNFC